MGSAEQISIRNADGTHTLDMWGVSYAAPMNDLRAHPPMALFRYEGAAKEYRDTNGVRPCAVHHLDVRLLRVTVGPWVAPPFKPVRGERVLGIDAEGVEWEGPYAYPGDFEGHWLGTDSNKIRVASVYPVEVKHG